MPASELPILTHMHVLNLRDTPKCLPALAHWHHAQWSYLNPTRTLEQHIAGMQAHLGAALVPSTVVAVDNTLLLGSAAIVASDMDTHPELTPWLASVYVTPERRRQGVGSMLVLHVMHTAATAGVERMFLFTPDREAFYQRLGWSPMLREQYRGYEVSVMQVALRRP